MYNKFVTIIDFIKHQLDIDISPISSISSKPKTFINIKLDKLECRQKRLIESLAISSKRFTLAPNGGYGYSLRVN